ncbi:MAG: hypothetical protein GX621_13945 [Pirellulaceae bacterium]|nr:hypothetical protein [Pirellulaceae bacterium]
MAALAAASATINDYAPYVYFKARRVIDANSRYEYGYDDNLTAANSTLVPSFYIHGPSATANVAVPYLTGDHPAYNNAAVLCKPQVTPPRNWRNSETFQILCPGLDGQYGQVATDPRATGTAASDVNRYRFSQSGRNFGEYDFDNMGNFSEGRLEDELQ